MANEKRLIDANALKEKAIRMVTVNSLGNKQHCYFKAVGTHEIDKAPTVDAVEVVRCKDCKYWSDGIKGCTDRVKFCSIGYYMVGENGYCGFGERKDNG